MHDDPNSAHAAFVSARQWARKARYARQKAAEAARAATKFGNWEITVALARARDAHSKIAKIAEVHAQHSLARAYRLAGAKNPVDVMLAKRLERRAFLSRVG